MTLGTLRGAKISSRHSSYTREAEVVIRAAKARPEVSKVVLSIIRPCRGGERRLKFKPIDAGLEVQVRGRDAVQVLYLYTGAPDATAAAIAAAWEANR